MKSKCFLIGLCIGLILACSCSAQITDTATLRSYINSNIVPNGTRSITATQLNTSFNGILNVLPNSGKTIFNSSSRLTGNRWVSGYLSATARNSLVFDTLGNFEVHAYGASGAYNPSYHGMRIIMNSSAGVMDFGWQNESGRGAVTMLPGSVSLSAQTGTTDNRLGLGLDGNKLLLNNPTTSGTNQLFQIDRVGGVVTLYGYPNTTGKLLSTDATGKMVLVDAPAPTVASFQDVTTAGNTSTNAIALTGLSDNIPTSGGNMLLLKQGDGEAYIESVDKPSNIYNPIHINGSTIFLGGNTTTTGQINGVPATSSDGMVTRQQLTDSLSSRPNIYTSNSTISESVRQVNLATDGLLSFFGLTSSGNSTRFTVSGASQNVDATMNNSATGESSNFSVRINQHDYSVVNPATGSTYITVSPTQIWTQSEIPSGQHHASFTSAISYDHRIYSNPANDGFSTLMTPSQFAFNKRELDVPTPLVEINTTGTTLDVKGNTRTQGFATNVRVIDTDVSVTVSVTDYTILLETPSTGTTQSITLPNPAGSDNIGREIELVENSSDTWNLNYTVISPGGPAFTVLPANTTTKLKAINGQWYKVK